MTQPELAVSAQSSPKVGLVERALRFFASGRALALAAALGVVLALPSIGTGLQTEDVLHRERIAEHPGLTWKCFDLFGYVGHRANDVVEGRDFGVLPWWASDELKISFFRPLSSAWHCFDYSFFPRAPWLMHAESLALFGALVVALGFFYRRMLASASAAGLATLLYAIDDAHGPALGWIANRNAILATLFGVLAAGLYDRARRDGERRAAILAPIALSASLLAAEAGIATFAYLLAYAVCLDRAPWRRRLLALAPHLAVVAAWRVAWVALGYGTRASALYVDPLASPSAFIESAARRAPILLFAELGFRPSDTFVLESPRRALVLVVVAVVAIVVVAAVLAPLLWRSATARFFALGAALSTLACCAAPPSDRLLFFVGLGTMALVAELLVALVAGAPWMPAARSLRWPARALGLAFVAAHLVYAPIRLPSRSVEVARAGDAIHEAATAIFAGATPEEPVVVVRGPEMFGCTFAVSLGYRLRGSKDSIGLCLSGGPSPMRVRRIDDRTLLLRPAGGFFDIGLNRMHWNAERPLAPGDRLATLAFDVRIVAVDERGEPMAAELEFHEPLEKFAPRWLAWEHGRYVPFELPAKGEERTVAGSDAWSG